MLEKLKESSRLDLIKAFFELLWIQLRILNVSLWFVTYIVFLLMGMSSCITWLIQGNQNNICLPVSTGNWSTYDKCFTWYPNKISNSSSQLIFLKRFPCTTILSLPVLIFQWGFYPIAVTINVVVNQIAGWHQHHCPQ